MKKCTISKNLTKRSAALNRRYCLGTVKVIVLFGVLSILNLVLVIVLLPKIEWFSVVSAVLCLACTVYNLYMRFSPKGKAIMEENNKSKKSK
jgi:hypothetical protein